MGDSPLIVRFKRLTEMARMPVQAYPRDAGWDLISTVGMQIQGGCTGGVSTGLAIEIPPGWCGIIRPRSGLGAASIDVHGGVIDCGYRGEIRVLLHNDGREPIRIYLGDRVAQLAFVPVPEVRWIEVEELSASTRNEGGFGSTGR